jgi:hypothetical protein
MLAMIAGLQGQRRKPQVNAIDQGFGTYRLLRQGEAGEDRRGRGPWHLVSG